MTEEKNEVIFDDDKISKSEEFVNPEDLYQELIRCVQKYHPSDDISMIEKAYKVASEAHKNQFRKSGEPYIIHPLNVAIILADLKLDKETIVAGILHDVVEDTVMTEEDLKREFGDGASGRRRDETGEDPTVRQRRTVGCQAGDAGGEPA